MRQPEALCVDALRQIAPGQLQVRPLAKGREQSIREPFVAVSSGKATESARIRSVHVVQHGRLERGTTLVCRVQPRWGQRASAASIRVQPSDGGTGGEGSCTESFARRVGRLIGQQLPWSTGYPTFPVCTSSDPAAAGGCEGYRPSTRPTTTSFARLLFGRGAFAKLLFSLFFLPAPADRAREPWPLRPPTPTSRRTCARSAPCSPPACCGCAAARPRTWRGTLPYMPVTWERVRYTYRPTRAVMRLRNRRTA